MINKLIKLFVKYRDKIDHFLVAFLLMCLTYLIHPFVGCAAVTALAVGKEIYDSKKNGSVEMLDIVFTVAGEIAGFVNMMAAGILK